MFLLKPHGINVTSRKQENASEAYKTLLFWKHLFLRAAERKMKTSVAKKIFPCSTRLLQSKQQRRFLRGPFVMTMAVVTVYILCNVCCNFHFV